MIPQPVSVAVEQIAVVLPRTNTVVVTLGGQGVPGAPGPAGWTTVTKTAAVDIPAFTAVTLNASGQAVPANYALPADLWGVFGVTTATVVTGATVTIMRDGELTNPLWNWTLDAPIYFDANGLLTQVAPLAPAAYFSQVVGFPITTTSAFIGIRQPSILAPGALAIVASEAINAGEMVNVWNDAGTVKVRKAAAVVGQEADGFVLDSVALGGSVLVHFQGHATPIAGLTVGSRYFLSVTPGAVTLAPPVTGVVQYLGKAVSANILAVNPDVGVVL